MRKFFIILICFFIIGCGKKYNNDVQVNYPITGINDLDIKTTSYVQKNYTDFKKKHNGGKLNIDYTCNVINDIYSISIHTQIEDKKEINKIKTFTYNLKTNRFLTIENIVPDLNVLDSEIKKAIINEYQDINVNNLSTIDYTSFSLNDKSLTFYLNVKDVKKNEEIIYLDIPLNSLNLLIDIDKSKGSNNYISLKKRNITLDDKVIALTFDDGPSKYTDDILDILKKNNACATFFVVGDNVRKFEDTIIKMYDYGNEIGNHSYTHRWLSKLSKDEFINEIDLTQKEIKWITGFTPTLFRPTYGGYSDRLKKYTDLTFVLWDVDSNDWKVRNKYKIIDNVINGAKNGSIVLMHDNHRYSMDALDELIKKLKKDHYHFVTVSELLQLKKLRES